MDGEWKQFYEAVMDALRNEIPNLVRKELGNQQNDFRELDRSLTAISNRVDRLEQRLEQRLENQFKCIVFGFVITFMFIMIQCCCCNREFKRKSKRHQHE